MRSPVVRAVNRLSVLKIKALKKPGRYNDGGGLYLYVSKAGNRSWVFRYRDRITSKLRDKGLGALHDVTLEQAREEASKCRETLRAGADPIAAKAERREAEKAAHAKQKTFGYCVEHCITGLKAGWRNAKHAQQWQNTLETYAGALNGRPVSTIDTADVLEVLTPIWQTKTETATRVRQRLEAVLNWATARGYRKGENPARWGGHLDKLLPAPTKLKTVRHQPAMSYAALPAYMAILRESDALSAKALELQILTATRPDEACGARWAEFDLDAARWTIPANRTKTHRAHNVPLAPALVKMLSKLPRDASGYLFPGKPKRPITTAAPLKLLQEKHPELTCHGFRSSFRDWSAEQTNYANEVCEAALAHTIKNKAEQAYRRTDIYEKRARLMNEWARYLSKPTNQGSNVTQLAAKRKTAAK